jgi:hypothetical protein
MLPIHKDLKSQFHYFLKSETAINPATHILMAVSENVVIRLTHKSVLLTTLYEARNKATQVTFTTSRWLMHIPIQGNLHWRCCSRWSSGYRACHRAQGLRLTPAEDDGFLRAIRIRSTTSFGGKVKPSPHDVRFHGMLKIPVEYERNTSPQN